VPPTAPPTVPPTDPPVTVPDTEEPVPVPPQYVTAQWTSADGNSLGVAFTNNQLSVLFTSPAAGWTDGTVVVISPKKLRVSFQTVDPATSATVTSTITVTFDGENINFSVS